MSGAEIVTYLADRGVSVTLAGSELEIDAPAGVLTDSLLERIRARKDEVLTFLQTAAERPDWKADCAGLFEAARAQCARNLDLGLCPDCGGGLLENKLRDEQAWYCTTCDCTWCASDFAEIRAYLARHKPRRKAA
jgi:glutaminase